MPGRSTDQRTLGEALSYPGIDPRIWCSYATVDRTDEEGKEAVEFDEEDGQIYVSCTLQPSLIPVRARVAMSFAGAGEACWFPMQAGDEVVVLLPEGDPRAGAIIVGRPNNQFDPFPFASVAGADPKLNSFGVFRLRAALTFESGASIMMRSAAAGAFVRVDAKGGVTLRDGTAGVLQMNGDVFGYQSGEGDSFLQVDLNDRRFNFQVGEANATLSGNGTDPATGGRSILKLPATFTVAVGGADQNTAVEHVVTTEALANVLVQVLAAVGANIAAVSPGPLTGVALGTLLNAMTTPTVQTAIAAGITAAAGSQQLPLVAQAIFAALSAPTAKAPGIPGFGQLSPGIGSQGFLTG